jgi:dihydrolipoamide dehydrogenase
LLHLAKRLPEFGIHTEEIRVDWAAAVDRAQRIVHGCGDPKPEDLRAQGVHLVFGVGQFSDPHTIAVNDERLHGDQILIATGAHTAKPPIDGLEQALTHVEILELRQPPSSLTVIGGGVIAMEFAYMFAQLGTRVTVLELLDQILANVDEDLRAAVAAHAAKLGIEIRTGVRVTSIRRDSGAFRVEAAAGTGGTVSVTSEIVLLAAGQVPTIDDLGLDKAGVMYDQHGIETDSTLRTRVPHIWAAGDVRRGSPQLSPIASHGARLAARNALLGRSDPFDESLVPYIVGLTPTVAGVGLTKQGAVERGIETFEHTQSYASVCPAANVVGEPEGFVKLIFARNDRRLLGAHAFGASAGELVQQMAFPIRAKLTAPDLAEMLFVFPGLSQVLEYAVRPRPGD